MTKELEYAHKALDIQIASLSSHNNNIPISERIGDQRVFLEIMVRAAEAERNARNEREREEWKRSDEARQLRAAATTYFDENILPLIGNRADIHTERERFIGWYVKPENVDLTITQRVIDAVESMKTRQYRGSESMSRPDLRVPR